MYSCNITVLNVKVKIKGEKTAVWPRSVLTLNHRGLRTHSGCETEYDWDGAPEIKSTELVFI